MALMSIENLAVERRLFDASLELHEGEVLGLIAQGLTNQQIAEDILLCGSSGLSWEESSRCLSNLYRLDLHSKEIYAFYFLHEISNQFYIDSPLPMRQTV